MKNQTKPKKLKTYFVTVIIDIQYECYARSEEEALEKYDEAFEDAEQRMDMIADEHIEVEDADTHFNK